MANSEDSEFDLFENNDVEEEELESGECDIRFRLIEEVRKHIVLWKMADPSYKKSDARTNAWKEVSNSISIEVGVAKKLWKSLVASYNRIKRELRWKSGKENDEGVIIDGTEEVSWQYWEPMQFLGGRKRFVITRKKIQPLEQFQPMSTFKKSENTPPARRGVRNVNSEQISSSTSASASRSALVDETDDVTPQPLSKKRRQSCSDYAVQLKQALIASRSERSPFYNTGRRITDTLDGFNKLSELYAVYAEEQIEHVVTSLKLGAAKLKSAGRVHVPAFQELPISELNPEVFLPSVTCDAVQDSVIIIQ